jgi:GTP-binding protein
MVEKYLASRPNLVLSIAITDSRHEPTRLDQAMWQWLISRDKPFAVVATKADKPGGNKLRANLKNASSHLAGKELIPYSAITRRGADRLWKEISRAIGDRAQ